MARLNPKRLRNKRLTSHGRELKADCPYCDGPRKLYVNTVNGLFYCHRCRVKGKITDEIVKDVFGEIPIQFEEPEPLPLVHESVRAVPRAMAYLQRRGIEPQDDWVYCVYGKYSDRILMPIKMSGKYYGFIGRAISDSNPIRYRTSLNLPTGSILWGFDRLGDTATICEGIFDATKFSNGVATFTCNLSVRQATLLANRCSSIEIAYDWGAEKDSVKAAMKLFDFGIPNKVIVLPKKDPAECTVEELAQAKRISAWELIQRR